MSLLSNHAGTCNTGAAIMTAPIVITERFGKRCRPAIGVSSVLAVEAPDDLAAGRLLRLAGHHPP